MIFNLRKTSLIEEIDYNFLKSALADYRHPRVKINEMLKNGKIIRVKKGLYVFGTELAEQPYAKETLANLIYGPSYISLEYALAFYGFIPERVEAITSITNKRNKSFDTPVGYFSYRYINPDIYSYGVTLSEIDNYHSILIASSEKAIADILYFNTRFVDESELEKYLLDNLRIESESLSGLNLKNVSNLAKLYGHNVNLFYNLLKDYK
jgi:predicted transcriptional regulator of viral defense system